MVSWMVLGLGCMAGSDPGQPAQAPAVQSVTSALTGSVVAQYDFEDGAVLPWKSFGGSSPNPLLTNSTDVAFTGTHSLLTTNRTATFMGPSIDLTSQLSAGATYSFSVAAQLPAAGPSPATLKITAMRTPAGGSAVFETINGGTSVSAGGWTTLTGTYSFGVASSVIVYVESTSATASYYIDAFTVTQTSPPPLSWDFEDGTTQGWGPFGNGTDPKVANSTDVALTGTHSLLTTNRSASFMGPSISLQNQLARGGTYLFTLSARLQTGQPQSSLQATLQRTPPGASSSFDTVVTLSNVTDQGWVTAKALYTLPTDTTGLTFYVQGPVGVSFYIDTVSVSQVAPPPPAPPAPNTVVAANTFETGTTEGWKPRIGEETVAVSSNDAHNSTFSLLTTRKNAFDGPALDVTNTMFPLSRYFVSVWAKLAPGQPDAQLRVSIDRKGGGLEDFWTVIGNTTVTANAWVRLQGTFSQTFGGSSLTLYVESQSSTNSPPAFYIDDFSVTYLPPVVAETNIPSVYQSVANVFPIVGAAVIPADITGQPAVLLSKHFNSMTSGNDMKWDATEPTEGNFSYTNADPQVAFAQSHNMHVRGHTMIWHNQTPAWVFTHTDGTPLTSSPPDQLILTQRIQKHITTLMNHFNTVDVWDVVNEPIDETQIDGYRRSPWYNILGKQYIPIALAAAHAANPNAKLYINEFNTTIPAKRQWLLALVSELKGNGVPIDGIGHQMHNNTQFPSPQSIVDTINMFDALGVQQAVTEMDVSIYNGSLTTPFTSYTDIPQSVHIGAGYAYSGFVQALKQVASKLVSVTIWGTSDDKSWLTSSTKVDAPLLFDPSLQHKYAYWAFVDPLQLPGADLSTTLTAAPSPVASGQDVTFTITVTNNADTGASAQPYDPTDDDLPAANVTMTMAIPSHTMFKTLSAPNGWNCTTGGQVSCTNPSLAVGASAQFTLTVNQSDCSLPDGQSITGSANVTSTTADPNPAPNNMASASIQVSNSPPVITAQGPLSVTTECALPYSDAGATALDACDPTTSVSTKNGVNTSVVGSYIVTYNATDSAGGKATPVVRTVQVVDTTPPVVTPTGPNPMTVECATTFNDPGATASDTCAGPLPVTETGAVDTSKVGNYPLTYSTSDPSDNSASASRLVTVSDTTPPVLNVGPGSALSPPDHTYRTITVPSLVTGASDTCDGSVGVGSVVITKVTSDEPDNGNGDGNTVNDIVIASDCHSVQLRSERAGPLNGRVYTLTLRVKDASGNSTTKTVKVTVPLSDTSGPAIDDGPMNTVLSACN
jgi:endo-1,4-beta-xylanase